MVRKSTADAPPKIAIYARKSKATETGKSIENQITKCRQYALAKLNAAESDLIIFQDYGLSGFYADRPAYQNMMTAILTGNISAVLCYKIDRISRKTLDLLNFIELLKQKNIAFISCTDDIDTQSKTGKIMLSLLASIAEFERDIITERITDNLYELAKEGRWLGGVTPMGYQSVPHHTYQNGKKLISHDLKLIQEEAAVIQQLYALFLKTRSLKQTATQLREKGICTRKKQPYTPKAIKSILENPVYAIADTASYQYIKEQHIPLYAEQTQFDGKRGLLAYNKTHQTKEPDSNQQGIYKRTHQKQELSRWIVTVGQHQGIISGTEWVCAQAILKENQNKYCRPKETSKALLSGKMRCPICQGDTYVRTYSNRYTTDGDLKYTYVCKEKYKDHTACPHSPNIPGNEFDKIVWLKLTDVCCKQTQGYLNTIQEQLQQEQKHLSLPEESPHTQQEKEIYKLTQAIEQQIMNVRTAAENIRPLLLTDISQMQEKKEFLQNQYATQQQCAMLASQQKKVVLSQRKKQLLSWLFHPQAFWQKANSQFISTLALFPQTFIQHISIDQTQKKIFLFLQKENASCHE